MLALAYDSALRREELCSLRTDDLDPAHRTLRVRAETTKTRRGRVVPYSAATGVLLSDYLAHRAGISRARGPLFLSESRRNHGEPLSLWTLVEGGAAGRAGCRCSAVLHAHHPAPVSDRPGPDGLGAARDRHLRRAPIDRVDADLHSPVGPGSCGEAESFDDAPACAARSACSPQPTRDADGSGVTAAVRAVGTATEPRSRRGRFRCPCERYDRRGELTDAERTRTARVGPEGLAPQQSPGYPTPDREPLDGAGPPRRAARHRAGRVASRR